MLNILEVRITTQDFHSLLWVLGITGPCFVVVCLVFFSPEYHNSIKAENLICKIRIISSISLIK